MECRVITCRHCGKVVQVVKHSSRVYCTDACKIAHYKAIKYQTIYHRHYRPKYRQLKRERIANSLAGCHHNTRLSRVSR